MVQKNILEVLQKEIVIGKERENNKQDSPVVILRGRNARSSKALFNRELIIRYFPFHIGRIGNEKTTFRNEPDLLLEDHSPYYLSRLHLILKRISGMVFLSDPLSRSGSLVDGKPLGEKIGGTGEMLLPPGRHEIRMGGSNSPFDFTIDVAIDDGSYSVQENVLFGDRTVPVSVLYHRLCRQTSLVFSQFFKDSAFSFRMANDLVQSILKYPGIIDPLYYFSSVPETFKDAIVTHSFNVAVYALKLAKTIPVTGEDLVKFTLAALFHDIGMFDIPPAIINKQDLVTNEEFEAIKRHPQDGKSRLIEIKDADALLPTVALEHHERIDGKGYPGRSRTLSEYVELIGMVDFFEALTHYRPQRGPVTPHEGMRMLIQLKKGIFSPSLVKLFIKGFSLFPVYSVVRLNTGEIGQVVATNSDWPLRPVVRIFFDRNGRAVSGGQEIDLGKMNFVYIARDISDRVFVDHYFKL